MAWIIMLKTPLIAFLQGIKKSVKGAEHKKPYIYVLTKIYGFLHALD